MNKTIKIVLVVIVVVAAFAAGTLFGKTLSKTETTTTLTTETTESEQISQTEETTTNTTASENNAKIKAEFTGAGIGTEFGRQGEKAKVTGVKVAKADDGYVLIIDFDFTNENDEARNFINDTYCNVNAFQDGIELDDPVVDAQKGVYDYSEAFTQIKSGAKISTQLVFILRNTTSPVELELGLDPDYKPQVKTTVKITKE